MYVWNLLSSCWFFLFGQHHDALSVQVNRRYTEIIKENSDKAFQLYQFRYSEVDEETGNSQTSSNKSWETIARMEGTVSDSSFCKFIPNINISSSLEKKCEKRTFVG